VVCLRTWKVDSATLNDIPHIIRIDRRARYFVPYITSILHISLYCTTKKPFFIHFFQQFICNFNTHIPQNRVNAAMRTYSSHSFSFFINISPLHNSRRIENRQTIKTAAYCTFFYPYTILKTIIMNLIVIHKKGKQNN